MGDVPVRRSLLFATLAPSVPRFDPFDGFKVYDNHYNLLSKNYYGSLGFTGLFGIVVGFICLCVPIAWLLWLLLRSVLRNCCARCQAVRTAERSPRARRIALGLAAFFGAACVCGAASVWAAGGVLRASLVYMSDILNEETKKLVNGTLTVLGLVAVVSPGLTPLGANLAPLTAAADELRVAAVKLQGKLDANHERIYGGFDRLQLGATLLGAFLILLVLLAWAAHGLAPRRTLRHLLLFSGTLQWVFLVVGWVICGVTYVVYLLVADTCLVIPDALNDPLGSGLAALIPCFHPAFQASSSAAVRAPVFTAVEAMNGALRQCSGSGGPLSVDFLCNPVVSVVLASPGGAYATRNVPCAAGNTTSLGAFAATYNATTCPYLPSASLGGLAGASAAAGVLALATPLVDALLDCSLVAEALEVVHSKCPDLQRGARGLFGGLLLCVLAFSPFLCVLVWAWRHAYEPDGAVLVVGTDVDAENKAAEDDAKDVEAPAPAAETEAPPPVEAAAQ